MSKSNLAIIPCNNSQDWLTRIQEIAKDSSRVVFTHHSVKRMEERSLTRRQVLKVFTHGSFAEEPAMSAKGNYEFKMRQHTCGEFISAVGALDTDENGNFIIVVTTYSGEV